MDKKLANTKQANVLWVDLEMTGLDPAEDRILEVAAIVTDWNYKEVATYQAAVVVDDAIIQNRMVQGPATQFWETVPATRDALIAQNKSHGRASATIGDELLAFIDAHFDADTPVVLAGNSIHQDRKFIDREWPRLSKRLHYRMLDVSAWKLVFEHTYRKKFAKPEVHRALDDIRGSIEELQYYLKKVKK